MTAIRAAVLALASLLPQEAPHIDEMPRRVCFDAPRAIFQVENKAAVPVLVAVGVERWSDEGDGEGWAVVHQDVTQREARPKKVRSVTLEPGKRRRDFVWDLQKRVGPPALATGRHRLVVAYSYESGAPPATVTHEFVIADCGI